MHWASCSTRCSPALIQDVNVRKVRLGEIITRCTALLPEQRYASVEELKAALTSRSSKSAPPRPARKSHPVLAFLLSIGAIMVGTSLSIPTKTSAQHLMQDHICVTLWLLFLVMLPCNIGGISDKLPILRRSNRLRIPVLACCSPGFWLQDCCVFCIFFNPYFRIGSPSRSSSRLI